MTKLMLNEELGIEFPVVALGPNDKAEDRATCGTCGRSWDDAVVTSYTPAPSGRCPFETFHTPAKQTLSRKEIERRLSLYYSERFSGEVACSYDERKRAYSIHGSGLPSHPSCPTQTWSLLDYVKPSDARQLVKGQSDAELKAMALTKAAEVRAEADRIVEGPDHPWRKARDASNATPDEPATTWYEANTGNHQGLIVEEKTGRNIAVTYDKADAARIVRDHNSHDVVLDALRERFPWLGTEQSVSGADVVDELNQLYEELVDPDSEADNAEQDEADATRKSLDPAEAPESLTCPNCGNVGAAQGALLRATDSATSITPSIGATLTATTRAN